MRVLKDKKKEEKHLFRQYSILELSDNEVESDRDNEEDVQT